MSAYKRDGRDGKRSQKRKLGSDEDLRRRAQAQLAQVAASKLRIQLMEEIKRKTAYIAKMKVEYKQAKKDLAEESDPDLIDDDEENNLVLFANQIRQQKKSVRAMRKELASLDDAHDEAIKKVGKKIKKGTPKAASLGPHIRDDTVEKRREASASPSISRPHCANPKESSST